MIANHIRSCRKWFCMALAAAAYGALPAQAGEKASELPKFPVMICQHRQVGTIMPSEVRKNAGLVNVLLPMWYQATDAGDCEPLADNTGPRGPYLDEAHRLGIKVLPIVRNFAPRKLLGNPAAVQRLAEQVAAMVAREKTDGVMIDLEELQSADRAPMVELTRLLRGQKELEGKLLSLALPRRSHNGSVDYEGLSHNVDFMLVMFYDYVGSWNKILGPTAPLTWPVDVPGDIKRDLANILATGAPRNKLVFGVPVYGNDFVLDPATRKVLSVKGIYIDDIEKLRKKYGAEPQWDESTRSVFFDYTSEDGATHQVWYEDARTLKEKIDFAQSENLSGIGVWAAAFADRNGASDLWKALSDFKKQP